MSESNKNNNQIELVIHDSNSENNESKEIDTKKNITDNNKDSEWNTESSSNSKSKNNGSTNMNEEKVAMKVSKSDSSDIKVTTEPVKSDIPQDFTITSPTLKDKLKIIQDAIKKSNSKSKNLDNNDSTDINEEKIALKVSESNSSDWVIIPQNEISKDLPPYTQCEKLIQSENDKREYSLIKLANEMHVLLISDKDVALSSASIKMGIGSLHEPKEFPGLAHFLEHMLFLGSKKYPNPEDYEKHFEKYGGSNDAETQDLQTNYIFQCSPEGFYEGLDRTAEFFKSPLFDENYVDKEIEAVNSEFIGTSQDDDARSEQVLQHISDEKSFYNRFTWGNKQTLRKPGIKQALLDFHEKYYSSNITFACLHHNEPIETMRKHAIEILSDIKNKNVVVPDHKDEPVPFGNNQLEKQIKFQSVNEESHIVIYFVLPYYNPNDDGSLDYIARLLEHKGQGSLFTELYDLDWIDDIEACYEYIGKNSCILYSISLSLTETGLKKHKMACSVVFSYLNMLRKNEQEEWLHEELDKVCKLDFKFQQKESAWDYIGEICGEFGIYKNEELLCHNYSLGEYSPKRIKEQLSYMKCENSFMFLTAYEMKLPKKCKKEPYFDIKYTIENYTSHLREIITTDLHEPDFEFSYPTPNEYIPKKFELLCETDEKLQDKEKVDPYKILSNEECDLWYKPDLTYKEPRVKIHLQLYNTENSRPMKPTELFQLQMWQGQLELELKEELDNANLASVEFDMKVDECGIWLSISCFSDSLTKFVDDFCQKLRNFGENFDVEKFEEVKDSAWDELSIFESDPEDQADHWMDIILNPKQTACSKLEDAFNKVTYKDFKQFIKGKIWKKLFMMGFIAGNLTEEKALEVYNKIRDSLFAFNKFEPMDRKDIAQFPITNIPKNSRSVYYTYLTNEDEKNSAIQLYVQHEPVIDDKEKNKTEIHCLAILSQMIETTFYNEIRTNQQLGYSVGNELSEQLGVYGLYFSVQGDKKDPNYVSERIMEVFTNYSDNLEKCTEEDFLKTRQSYQKEALEKPLTQFNEIDELYSGQLETHKHNWDCNNRTKEIVENITKDDVYNVYKKLVQDGKIIEVHAVSNSIKKKYNQELKKRKCSVIKGFMKFHRDCGEYEDRFPYEPLEVIDEKKNDVNL